MKRSYIKADPYYIEDQIVRREWDRIHEGYGKAVNMQVFMQAKPVFYIGDVLVYALITSNEVQYIVFDTNDKATATGYVLFCIFKRVKTRHNLFSANAKGWYPNHVWKSKNSGLPNYFMISFLQEVFDHLDADFLVTDFAQTLAFTKTFSRYLSLYVKIGTVFAGLSYMDHLTFAVSIKNDHQLQVAVNKTLAKNFASAYKCLFIIKDKNALNRCISKNVIEATFDQAERSKLFDSSLMSQAALQLLEDESGMQVFDRSKKNRNKGK